MKSRKAALLLILAVAIPAVLFASDQKDKKGAGSNKKVWDSGTFSIYMNGKKIGNEKFSIEQRSDVSVATSEIKVEDSGFKADQTAEMQVTPKGELRSYSWRSNSPTKEESLVEPKEQLLIEHVIPADQKKMDVPHILPLSTVILDDNFFSHRELLVWRYLSTGCVQDKNGLMCGPSHFGILVPRQHLAADAVVDLIGREKTTIKGQEQELNKLKMQTDKVEWLLWVSDDYKVLKMSIPSQNVEVVRD
jgi:hypothetical protein